MKKDIIWMRVQALFCALRRSMKTLQPGLIATLRMRRAALLLIAIMSSIIMMSSVWLPVLAQPTSTRVELAGVRPADELLLHVRVLRGQTIEEAALIPADVEDPDAALPLTASPVALPVTRWIVLDASDAMINLQSTVVGGIQNFLRDSSTQTGIIIYGSDVTVLRPTDRQSEIDNFLAEYTATADEPGCAADALYEIAARPRDPQRSLRILWVMGGLSRQTTCTREAFEALPAPVDIVAVTGDVSDPVRELVERSGGEIYRANLRTVEARLNEVRTSWGQPTYALRGEFNGDAPQRGTLDITLSNGIEEQVAVRFQEYDFLTPPEPTATATDIILATIPARETDTPAAPALQAEETAAAAAPLPTGNPPPTAIIDEPPPPTNGNGDENSVVILLIAGAVLFVLGAVVLALALANIRRRPNPQTQAAFSENFYDTLEDERENVVNTRIGTREIVQDDDVVITRMSDMEPASPSTGTRELDEPMETNIMPDSEAAEAESTDELLVTRVLSDEGFQKMMQQSRKEDEIVGWLHLESDEAEHDYELTRRGALVGRSQECDIQIKGDPAISRKHLRFDVDDDGQVTIVRESTTNPVVVGGVQVSNRLPLQSNDVIHLSDKTRLIFIRRDNQPDDDDSSDDDDSFDADVTRI